MFGKFWDKYRYLVEATAFVTALAGIFLAIPDPEQEAAYIALLNVRFVWLSLTTLGMGSLLVVLLMHWQSERAKNVRDVFFVAKGGLSLFLMLMVVILLDNMWRYMSAIYSARAPDFLAKLTLPVWWLIFSLASAFVEISDTQYSRQKASHILLLIAITVIAGATFAAWNRLAALEFSWNAWFSDLALGIRLPPLS